MCVLSERVCPLSLTYIKFYRTRIIFGFICAWWLICPQWSKVTHYEGITKKKTIHYAGYIFRATHYTDLCHHTVTLWMVVCYDPELRHWLIVGDVTIPESQDVLMSQREVAIQAMLPFKISLVLWEKHFYCHQGILIICFVDLPIASLPCQSHRHIINSSSLYYLW